MQIHQHALAGDKVTRRESPNRGGALHPQFVVMHFTAGRDADSSVRWLTQPEAKASAHVVVGRDGGITQLVPFDRVAWHAGASSWSGIDGLNSCSIGIEMDNMGELTRSGSRYLSWFKGQVPDDDVVAAPHRHDGVPSFWHDYTEPQIASALELVSLLCRTYEIREILGHDDIAPGRKRDPGPAFPMANFRSRLAGRQLDALARIRVTAEALNIRSGPATTFPLAAGALRRGTELVLEERQAAWSRVIVQNDPGVRGWVSNAYTEPA